MKSFDTHRGFWLACGFELALLLLAVLLGVCLRHSPCASFRWEAVGTLTGVAAAVPPFLLFLWLMRPGVRWSGPIRDFLETILRPFFESWAWPQLAVLALLAGVGEESLFRGVVQGALTPGAGWPAALLLASVLFGVCHFVNLPYALVATTMGAYLGLVWLSTGNLLAPIVTHALYDFAALVYLLRFHPPRPSS